MPLFIKNMVCARCRQAVRQILESLALHPLSVELGEVSIAEALSPARKTALSKALAEAGFELIDDRSSRLIGQIKTMIIGWVHHGEEQPAQKWSEVISKALHQDYSSLSRLFSETEGITIEQYFIQQKIERVKELMIYDELSLSQIALELDYSSVAHLSAQFKKVTGMTPTYFKNGQDKRRRPLDEAAQNDVNPFLQDVRVAGSARRSFVSSKTKAQ